MRQEWYKSRNQYYQLLQVGKQELGWDNGFYYDVWLPEQGATAIEGRISAKSLSIEQLDAALKRMKQSGFKPKAKNQTRALASDAQSRKIRALWLELHKKGVVRDPSEKALANFVARMYKIKALQWISPEQASKVIVGLDKWLKSSSGESS